MSLSWFFDGLFGVGGLCMFWFWFLVGFFFVFLFVGLLFFFVALKYL